MSATTKDTIGTPNPRRNSRDARETSQRIPALLEFHSPSAAIIAMPVSRGARGTVWIVMAMFFSFFAAAGIIPIDKVVTAPGKVVATAATMVVQPLETSIIRAINVREGQIVHPGDLMAQLDPTFTAADSAGYQAQVTSLQAEVDRLTAESQGVAYRPAEVNPSTQLQLAIFTQRSGEYTFKLENFAQKINSLQAQIARATSDLANYQQQLAVATTVEQKRKELERLQVGSQLNVLQAVNARLEAERAVKVSQAQLEGASRDLQALMAERDGYVQTAKAQTSQDLSDASRKLSDARENLNKATLRHQLVDIRADQEAQVLTVAHVSVGSVLQSGDQFLTLVPVDAPLEVEVNIPGADAGFVHVGNDVTVKFDTFPFTQYGGAEGQVRTISADSFSANGDDTRQRGAAQANGASTSGMAAASTFYRSKVTMDRISLHDTPPGFHLQPGMPVTADVRVGKRTVLSYIFSRVLPVAMDGMREP